MSIAHAQARAALLRHYAAKATAICLCARGERDVALQALQDEEFAALEALEQDARRQLQAWRAACAELMNRVVVLPKRPKINRRIIKRRRYFR